MLCHSGRCEAAGSKSMTLGWGYGFRARHLAVAPRNDSAHMIGFIESTHRLPVAVASRREFGHPDSVG